MASFLKRFRKSSTEEEIKQLVDEDEEVGELEDSQRKMINNIFEFDDINAGDIMTHRTDIEAAPDDSTLQEVANIAIENGCSRIPVYHEDLDDIIGIIYVKDLLKFIGTKISDDESIRDYLREPLFVPETISCGRLFAQMTETRIQLAIVVDEYGGTAGLVTMEDILESIVGNIQDEYDDEEAEIQQLDDNTFIVNGTVDIEDASNAIGVELPEGDYDTVAGFVINLLGYLPDEKTPGVFVEYKNLKFTVLEILDRRLERIKITVKKELLND